MNHDREIFTIALSIIGVLTLWTFACLQWGVNAENERLYNKCLAKNSEMVYNKAIEHCKEQVK